MLLQKNNRHRSWLRGLVGWAALLCGWSCRSEAPPARTRDVAAVSLQKQTSARFDQIVPMAGGLRLTRGNEVLEWRIGEPLPLPPDHHSSGQLTLRSVEDQLANVDYQMRFDARSFGKGITDDEGSFVLPCHSPAPQLVSEEDAKARALAFLKERNLDWGQPTGVLRTVSSWHRVEFTPGASGAERVVLVNPENGNAELPEKR